MCYRIVTACVTGLLILAPQASHAAQISDLMDNAEVKLDMRLRYENVDQDNDLKDADAMTLRTRLTLESGRYHRFSGIIEFEDSREAFIDDYHDGLGRRPNYSTIADPETTELDQAAIRYHDSKYQITVGRQVIALDNQRFVGHVGWRQDRQTFDAIQAQLTPFRGAKIQYAYLVQRNRIFAEDRDVDSSDHLLNASVQTTIGEVALYGYLLDEDDADNENNTYGIRFHGSRGADDIRISYAFEYAYQDVDISAGSFDTDYYQFEAGLSWQTFGLTGGWETLGSDNGNYGFTTPLATLHKFNGWADQFLTTPKQGLEDFYVGVHGQYQQLKWQLIYHNFDVDEESIGVDNLGDEWNASLVYQFDSNLSAGAKYAMYDAGDANAGKVDTDKLWLWLGASF